MRSPKNEAKAEVAILEQLRAHLDQGKPARTLAHPPLFQVMFAWQSHESGSYALPGLEVARKRNEQEAAKFDLSLELRERDGRITGGLNYAIALFDRATACRERGELDQALALFETLSRRHPRVPEVEAGRGETLLALGRWADAAAALDIALAQRPQMRGWLILRG